MRSGCPIPIQSGRGERNKPPHAIGEELLKRTRPPRAFCASPDLDSATEPEETEAEVRRPKNQLRPGEAKRRCPAQPSLPPPWPARKVKQRTQRHRTTPLPRRHGRLREAEQKKNGHPGLATTEHTVLIWRRPPAAGRRWLPERSTMKTWPGGHPMLRPSIVGDAPVAGSSRSPENSIPPPPRSAGVEHSSKIRSCQSCTDLIQRSGAGSTSDEGGSDENQHLPNGADLRAPAVSLRQTAEHRQRPRLP
jgi:hypothetical protein